jgi:spore coat polysaccharide biosynthesis protein SpsF
MGSTRLPGKVLKPIGTRPLLGHVVGRLEMLKHPHTAVVATSDLAADDATAAWCEDEGVTCFRGSEQDVLARYHGAASRFGLDPVVRLTADNPFTDIEELDRLIDLHQAEGNDFSQSFAALPIGVGAEIFSFDALAQSARDGHAPHHREHVDEYMIENPQIFRTGTLPVEGAKNRPDVRLTVDTEEDYRRTCFIAERAAGKWATTLEAIALCSRFA